jgi:hypothetical protein
MWTRALDVFRLKTPVTGHDIEADLVALVQNLEAFAENRTVMHKDIVARVLGDEPKTPFIVEPLDFAAGHISLLNFGPRAGKNKTTQRIDPSR